MVNGMGEPESINRCLFLNRNQTRKGKNKKKTEKRKGNKKRVAAMREKERVRSLEGG